MLVVKKKFRRNGIGRKLVEKFVEELRQQKADECTLETECVNIGALRLYESKFFVS